jgi:hypothetical protein
MWQRKFCLRNLRPSHITVTCVIVKLKEVKRVEGALFGQQLRTEKQTGNVASAQNWCARTTVSKQFKYHVTTARNNLTRDEFLLRLCSKLYLFLFSNILSISLYTIARTLENLNKSTVMTMKKCCESNFKNMGTKCTQFCKSRKFFCSLIKGLKIWYFQYTVTQTNLFFMWDLYGYFKSLQKLSVIDPTCQLFCSVLSC